MFYFQVHQPRRLNTLRFFDVGNHRAYFDDDLNRKILQRVAHACYLPANALLQKIIERHPSVKIAFSISGVALDQLEAYAPEVLQSFKALANTGSVEFLTETYYHSLACMMPGNEFEIQVAKHQQKVLKYFGVTSSVFRNTELIYSNSIGSRLAALGFKGVLIDGVDRMTGGRTPHHVFEHAGVDDLKLLLRDYRLSDAIAFRFSNVPEALTADRYIRWLEEVPDEHEVVTLGMDYETFGEHQKKETGIFSFLKSLLTNLSGHSRFRFITPSEAVHKIPVKDPLVVPGFISWADEEKDLSAWLGNEMQRDAFDSLVRLEAAVKNIHNKEMLYAWRHLQTSDHFYYMSTKKGSDGEVHTYFSPYPSPYEAFINFMNVLTDFDLRIKTKKAAALMPAETAAEMPASAAMAFDLASGAAFAFPK